ncbi:MAG TPA: peptidase M20, partial [Candidatus Hydrogenedentes bacterium]|nr:peptidase M20 [Candidatus Hydrogenedentota bacterium]
AVEAQETVFGRKSFFRREGASVPVIGMMQEELGVDSVMLGFGLPDDGIHGPNEKQSLSLLFKGMETYLRYMDILGSNV